MIFVIASLIFVYLLGFLLLVLAQERFLFLDEELDQDHQFSYDFPFEEFTLDGVDGGRLNALRFTVEEPDGVILYFHGNKGNLTRWGDIVSPFTKYQYDVVVMDYRGFGKSTGLRNQKNLLSDAELFYQRAIDLYGEEKITLYGRSMGTGIASYLAGLHRPKRLILETPYYSLAKAAQRFYPIYPSKFALRYNFKSFEYLQKADCPITIFHGTEDTVVPYEQGVSLYNSLNEKERNLVTIEGGEHRDLAKFPLYWDLLEKALKD